MRRYLKQIMLLAAIMLLAGVTAAYAELSQSHYTTLRGSHPTALKSAISAADSSFQLWSATPIAPQATLGNPKLNAKVTFNTAAATAAISVGLYSYNASDSTYAFLGVASIQTCTASSLRRDGTRYVTDALLTDIDTKGAPYYDLRVENISTGNVTVVPWLFGSASKGKD